MLLLRDGSRPSVRHELRKLSWCRSIASDSTKHPILRGDLSPDRSFLQLEDGLTTRSLCKQGLIWWTRERGLLSNERAFLSTVTGAVMSGNRKYEYQAPWKPTTVFALSRSARMATEQNLRKLDRRCATGNLNSTGAPSR